MEVNRQILSWLEYVFRMWQFAGFQSIPRRWNKEMDRDKPMRVCTSVRHLYPRAETLSSQLEYSKGQMMGTNEFGFFYDIYNVKSMFVFVHLESRELKTREWRIKVYSQSFKRIISENQT